MPCGPPGTILSLAPFTNLAEGSAESLTQHSPAFRHEGRELALKPLSCTAAPAVSDRRCTSDQGRCPPPLSPLRRRWRAPRTPETLSICQAIESYPCPR